MNKNVILRLFVIGIISLLLMVPLEMVRGVVRERSGNQQQAREAIAESSAHAQQVSGPFLAVAYRQFETITEENKQGNLVTRVVESTGEALFTAGELSFTGNIPVEEKYKGLYKALQFRLTGKIEADFVVPADLGLRTDKIRIAPLGARVLVPVSDLRGLRSTPQAAWNGEKISAAETIQRVGFGSALSFPVPIPEAGAKQHFAGTLDLIGTTSFAFAPTGKTTTVRLQSPWPHPGFGGHFLPLERSIGAQGFEAGWTIPNLATQNQVYASQALSKNAAQAWETLEIGFVEPANVYQQADRAVKYGSLFIILTFAGFFLHEVLARLRIHPVQYLLVGLTLAIFFLLLIAGSEHIAFAYAYFAAALACSVLSTFYMAHALGSWKRSLLFGAGLGALYGVLYGILISEDNALIMGALLLFAMLALIMLATRRVDWFAVSNKAADAMEEARAPLWEK